jgi:hypothetical protein
MKAAASAWLVRAERLELLAPVACGDEPLGATGDLGDIVMAEMLEQRIERRHDRGHGAERLDQRVARGLSLGIVDRVPSSFTIGSERGVPVSSLKTRICRVGKARSR